MSTATEKEINPYTKMALELGPLLVFFLANRYGEELAELHPLFAQMGGKIFVGTALFMVAMVISLILSRIIMGTIAIMPLVTGVFVLVFGGLTLYLQDEIFIKMKPTIVNMIFATILLGGLLFGKSLLAYIFGSAFKLDEEGWKKLTLRWGLFFIFLAVLNEVVWRNFSSDFWVNFKVWGTMPLTMIFMLFQFPLLKAHATEPLFEDDSTEA